MRVTGALFAKKILITPMITCTLEVLLWPFLSYARSRVITGLVRSTTHLCLAPKDANRLR